MHSKPYTKIVLSAFSAASLIVGLAACGQKSENADSKSDFASQSTTPVQSPLVGSEHIPTLATLYDTVTARALRGDTVGLLKIMVNDSVYREIVWPTTESYEPERDEVWNLVMSMHKSNSNKGLRRLMHDIMQPESGVVIRLPLGETSVEGGVLHQIPKTARTASGLVLFGSALCLESFGCQVLSYSQGGQRGLESSEESD